MDGYRAAPCWLLPAEGDVQTGGRNWFDAPAWDHAWWQKQRKRVLLYLHPGKGLDFGQARHTASQDIGGNIHNCFARATVKAGKPQVWLSVLMPFDEGEDPAEIAETIQSSVDGTDAAKATIGKIRVSITADGTWDIAR